MNLKKAAPTISIFLFAFIMFPAKTYAYWDIFGYKVPTNRWEVRETFQKIFLDEEKGIKVTERYYEATGEIPKSEISSERPVFVPLEKLVYEQVVGDMRIVRRSNETSLNMVTLTQDDVERMALEALKEQKLLEGNYAIRDLEIAFDYNTADLTIRVADGRAVQVSLTLDENGKNIIPTGIKSVGTRKIGDLELAVLEKGLVLVPSKVIEMNPSFTNSYEFLVFEPGQMKVWLK